MKRSCKDFIAGLEKHGLRFSSFALTQEGEYHPDDADWNYKDVPHLEHIHQLVDAVPARIDEDFIVSLNLQKVFGVTLPLTVVNLESGDHSQMYFTSFGFWALVIESSWEALDARRTRVTTTYHIGSRWLMRALVPLIRWSLKRNYRDLMTGDIPMRARRGQLRAWGYEFKRHGSRYGFAETMALAQSNVAPGSSFAPAPGEQASIDVSATLVKEGDEVLWGREDHLGLRIRREADKLLVFPRMCPHEGAGLDRAGCQRGVIRCPWHNRAFKPMTEIPTNGGLWNQDAGSHRFNLDRGRLHIELI